MGNPAGNELIQRSLGVVEAEGIVLLDAVSQIREGKRIVQLFFRSDADTLRVFPGEGLRVLETRSIGGAMWWTCEAEKTAGPLKMVFADTPVVIDPAPQETSIFGQKNCFVSIRNGETAGAVLDWLAYHVNHHGLQGAVILDRAEPGKDKGFLRKLRDGVKALPQPCTVLLLNGATPLGHPDRPAESHPFCAPDAPGKDRMEIPASDPWAAPLREVLIYEQIRNRFLGAARAVANIDVYDLMVEGEGPETLFDAAVAAPSGCIPLAGRHVYPWRTRKNAPATFGDHICVQFDARKLKQRWCIAPAQASDSAIWRLIRVGNVAMDVKDARLFYRFMSLRHPTPSVAKIVPKSSLVEHEPLLRIACKHFGAKPVRMPEIKPEKDAGRGRAAIVTCMKNEGPFILEWLAYHRAIGFDDFLVYTNDCTDGTDTMLDLLQKRGLVQHRDNPFKKSGLKPQHAALQAAESEEVMQKAGWLVCMDVDEFINIKCGDGTLDALFKAVPDANMIAMTWRLFGNADVDEYRDELITERFDRCAPEFANKPHQAWGFKTLYRNVGLFKKMGVHRPKGLNPQLWEQINWVNGSGKRLPKDIYRNAWRSTTETYGYDLVSLNHYAVRSAESFLVKRDRGRVNHVDRDQGLAYWFRMNNNAEEETSIKRMLPKLRAEYDKLLADPEIAAIHAEAVKRHRAKIDELRETEKYTIFYKELTGPRLRKLSRLHSHFGANVFLTGPDCVPDEVVAKDPEEEFFFTIERGETNH
ncbi:glycosyltransferase family 2 protein [Neptunicoccus sediminis]|uniref:glycosyltransferase family 2 protein n=1 Tax=Neptunicoccus sediminis TaxID=1892596 RepID=UPI0009F18B6C|nr:glycosyltransferase family 2 protein [Neptunicoccus sediminis]